MSLNKKQRRITAEELQAHFETSTLSVQMIAEKLNVTTEDGKSISYESATRHFSHQLQRFIHLVWDVQKCNK